MGSLLQVVGGFVAIEHYKSCTLSSGLKSVPIINVKLKRRESVCYVG